MHRIPYSTARARLATTMDQVLNNREAVIITRNKRESVVMLSLDDYRSMEESTYLLRNPHNAKRLLESIAQVEAGAPMVEKTLEELEVIAQ